MSLVDQEISHELVFNAPAQVTIPVRRIYCVGRNYVEHIREMRESDERDPPFFFQKPRDAIVLSGESIFYPSFTEDYQFEVELVVAIGKRGMELTKDQALQHIYGYAVGLDMTRRDRQRECGKQGLPWEIGKSFDFSSPCGDIHPVDQVGHFRKARISLSMNGVLRQDSNIEKMIWSVPEIVSNLSQQYELVPGDLIYTGTPAGVSSMVSGDKLIGLVEGLKPLDITIK
jgi:fumarylpyruvate hydrolase